MVARSEAPARAGGQRVDWQSWHAAYEQPSSPLARRLALVQQQLRDALDRAPAGPLRALSVCAGQGHDLIGALRGHPRAAEVDALLVELDAHNVEQARAAARRAGLPRVRAIAADASLTDSYATGVPADLLVVCGVFGNVSAGDVMRTIDELDRLCAPGATVVWTRHRNPPDLVPTMLERFARAGFEQVSLHDAAHFAVGVCTLRRPPRPYRPGVRLFDFVGHGALWPHLPADRRSALGALFDPNCSLVALVEAIRALPAGGAPGQTPEEMLREGRGLNPTRHRFLAEVVSNRFPETQPQIVHRAHLLDRERARAIYGDAVAAALPGGGLADVHRYLTLLLDGRRVPVDVSSAGEPWDGRGPLGPHCGPGEDHPAAGDPELELRELQLAHCDPAARSALVEALAAAGLPDPPSQP